MAHEATTRRADGVRDAASDEVARDAAVVRAARAGDRDAFDLLARRHVARLVGAARRLLGDPVEAEEAAADALLKAHAALGSLADDAALGPWLHRIACRCAIDRLRAKRASRRRAGFAVDLEDRRPDARPPVTRLAERERLTEVRRQVDRLPPVERLSILLHLWEGLSYEAIAEVLDSTYDSVRVSVAHARKTLAARLDLRDPPPPHGDDMHSVEEHRR